MSKRFLLFRWIPAVVLVGLIFVGAFLPGVVLADAPTKYEYFDAGDATDSDDIYSNFWTAMQFTTGTDPHTLTSVHLSLMRVGVPGYIYLSLREAESGLPVGYDLAVSDPVASLTLSLVAHDWVEFTFDGYALETSKEYALCLFAPDGDAAAYVLWEGHSAGGLANAVGSHTDTAGASWTSDDPVDYLFEVYGYVGMEILDVAVFNSFVEDDDWLFSILYYNEFEPYSPTEFAAQYFMLQLVSGNATNTTVIAQTNMRAWGNRPGSIYLSPDMAASLEWGANYSIRMYGLFGTNPYSWHYIQDEEWEGDEMLLLDHWVYTSARYIEQEEGSDLLEEIDVGVEALNSDGHVIFALGIPWLARIRPDLFESSVQSLMPDEESFSVTTTDATTSLGADVIGFLDDFRAFFGVDSAEEMGSIVGLGVGMAVIATLAALGHFFVGIGVAFVGLVGTTVVGITDWRVLGLVTFGAAIVWIFHHFANK